MEVSTDAISDREQKSLVKQCFEICSTLTDKGFKFSFSLKLGSSFNFSLSSEECSPKAKPRTRSRRPPAFYRRQIRRRAAFLEKKEKLTVPEEAVSENLLDKKVDSTVDNNTPLNLNPRAIYPRGSVESVEQVEDNCVNRDENNVDNKSPQSKPPAACPVDTGRDGGSVNTDGGTEKPTQGTKKYQEFLQEFRYRASRYRAYQEGDSGGRKFFKWTGELSHVTYDENFDGNLHWICDVCQGYNKSGKDIDDKNPAECSHCRKDWLAFEC